VTGRTGDAKKTHPDALTQMQPPTYLPPGSNTKDPRRTPMKETLNPEDRRYVRTSLVVTLAAVFTLLLSTIGWAGVHRPQAAATGTSTAAAAAPAENAPEATDADPGCGCSESCLAACMGLD
jgi:hypothetical protein